MESYIAAVAIIQGSMVGAADASITLPALTKFARLCWLITGAGHGRLPRLDH